MQINTLLLGCGNIAGLFNISNEYPKITHASVISNNKNFIFLACVDPDLSRLKKFKKKWAVKNIYTDIVDALENHQFDLVVICSPSFLHINHIKVILKYRPRMIFCEKPLTTSPNDLKIIKNIVRKNETKLIINYTRLFDKQIIKIRNYFYLNNKMGKIQSVNALYNKGILNNASHLISLLLFFFGKLKINHKHNNLYDFIKSDPTISFVLETTDKKPIFINTTDSRYYEVFEIDLLFTYGRIRLINSGQRVEIYKIKKNKIFKDYKSLHLVKSYNSDYFNCLNNAYHLIVNFFNGKDNKSIIENNINITLETEKLCHLIRKI